jgi:thiol-disulfide isomerase/thioredoxin
MQLLGSIPNHQPTSNTREDRSVEFWTYSCINWRRQLPYVRAWAEKYRDHGLAVVGVHSPEFPFERDLGNVHWAVNNMGMPIQSQLITIMRYGAFNNQYWPALYFIGLKGRIRHQVFGEGQYPVRNCPSRSCSPKQAPLSSGIN